MTRARRSIAACLAVLALALMGGAPATAGDTPEVWLFAAASTTEAIDEVARAFEASGRGKFKPVFAASSTLAQQIARGAPADLFLSANTAWMDHLTERGFIEPKSRSGLLGNALVLIAPNDSTLDIMIGPGFPLAGALGERRLAMGDPAHVPAGLYAKTALENLGVWPEVAPKAAYAGSVRAALAFVDRGEAAAGIVYATDALISQRVRIVARFPEGSHPDIVYPLAVVTGRRSAAVDSLYDFLHGPQAQAIFRAHGFLVPGAKE